MADRLEKYSDTSEMNGKSLKCIISLLKAVLTSKGPKKGSCPKLMLSFYFMFNIISTYHLVQIIKLRTAKLP